MNDKSQVKPNRPTIEELEKILAEGGGGIRVAPDGSVFVSREIDQLKAQVATLQAQLTEAQDHECEAASLYEGMKDQLTQAHKERDEALAACAVMRDLLPRTKRWPGGLRRVCQLKDDFDAALATDCGKAFLDRMKEAEWLICSIRVSHQGEFAKEREFMERADAFLKGGAK